MNLKMVIHTVGRMLVVLALLMLLPLICALIYGEFPTALAFLYTAAASAVVGIALSYFVKANNPVIYAREGFAITALVWLAVSAIGAIPFVLTHSVPTYADAFFETASGFTTTGASIMTDVEALSHGILFWRSFSHWVGGMGVLVFVMAIVPNLSDRSIHILRAEMPGPVVGKIVPRLKDTAKILYLIYIVLTLLEVMFLSFGEMSFFESLLHAFGTAGTGGFGLKANGISGYSAYSQWVIAIFMMLFGVNFNLYFLLLIRRFKAVLRSTELWCYLGLLVTATILITVNVATSVSQMFPSVSDTVRHSFFTVSSLVTTTGYATFDFNTLPGFSRAIVFILLFCGGCAGSTAGGLKMARVILLFKLACRDFHRMIHPRAVKRVRLEGKAVEESTLDGVSTYFGLYMICIFATFLLITLFDPAMSFETNLSAAVSCFNNVGPGLDTVGSMGSYAGYSGISKFVLSVAMLLGRLEIYPLMLALLPSTWRREK